MPQSVHRPSAVRDRKEALREHEGKGRQTEQTRQDEAADNSASHPRVVPHEPFPRGRGAVPAQPWTIRLASLSDHLERSFAGGWRKLGINLAEILYIQLD